MSKKRRAPTAPLRLGTTIIKPENDVRILGVRLDRKLNWGPQLKALQGKLKSQKLALSRLMGSTWGPRLKQARLVYLAVIRTVLGQGAPSWHTPASQGRVRGPAVALGREQNDSLRRVSGAFRSTPTRSLETEMFVPPIDIWLTARVAAFKERLEFTELGPKLAAATAAIRHRLRQRRGRRRRERQLQLPLRPTDHQKRVALAETWLGRRGEVEKRLAEDWRARWHAQGDSGASGGPTGRPPRPADCPPTEGNLRLHQGLHKAQSAILTQIRTGHIGLPAYLRRRKVPGVETDRCTCGLGPGSPRHRTVFCPELRAERRLLVEAVGAPLDFDQIVATPGKAQQLARWFVRFGRIKQFDLAAQLIEQHDEDRSLNGDGPPANQGRRGRD